MQLRVAKVLNQLLILIFVIVIALAVGLFIMLPRYPELKWVFLGSFVLVGIALFVVYRWLEQNWDKRVITRMAREGKVALANIRGASRIQPMRDTGFVRYWLYEFEGEIYDRKLNRVKKKFYEKMSEGTDRIPNGTVFVTYDEEKPNQIFIIPTAMIRSLPSLAPLVAQYESDKRIGIRYLDVYYNKGINIRTYKEAIDEHEKNIQESAEI